MSKSHAQATREELDGSAGELSASEKLRVMKAERQARLGKTGAGKPPRTPPKTPPKLPPKKVLPKLAAAAVGTTPQKEHGNVSFGVAQQHYAQGWEKEREEKLMDAWSVDIVADWIHRVRRMPKHVNAFLDQEIDGARLLGLMPRTQENELEWKELGVSVKDRIQISKAVRQYVEHEVEIEGGAEEAAGGFTKLLSMWEKGYVPEVDEEVEAEEKELLAKVRQEQAKLLLDRKSALETSTNVMMRMSAFAKQRYAAGRPRSLLCARA